MTSTLWQVTSIRPIISKTSSSAWFLWAELLGEPNAGTPRSPICSSPAPLILRYQRISIPLLRLGPRSRKVDLRGALDGAQAMEYSAATSPLLKFHGCLDRDRDATLWTQRQLDEATVQQRIQEHQELASDKLARQGSPDHGILDGLGILQCCPGRRCCRWRHRARVGDRSCFDGRTSTKGAGALGAPLRQGCTSLTLSDQAMRRFKNCERPSRKCGRGDFSGLPSPWLLVFPPPDPTGWLVRELYDLRRDAEGVPYNRAARQKVPAGEAAQAALAHVLLTQANATREGAWYRLKRQDDTRRPWRRRIALDRSGAHTTNQLRSRRPISSFVPALSTSLRHATVIPAGVGASLVRPARGGSAKWLTLEQARAELGI